MQFYNGLTEAAHADRDAEMGKMFRSLGQVIHLLQDTAQPQHVRNDWHLDLGSVNISALLQPFVPLVERPSLYERYVDAKPGLQNLGGTGASLIFSTPDQFFQELATFTNTNFVSAGTNCTNPTTCGSAGGYPLPNITGQSQRDVVDVIYSGNLQQCQSAFQLAVCQAFITEFANQFIDPLTGNTITNSRMTTRSIFDFDLMSLGLSPFFSLSSFNYVSQATVLIPKAVDYSAGLLNYFFRGSLSAHAPSSGKIEITNTSAESMNGTFSLYYDDANGTRYPLQGATWQLTIPPGGTSAPQTFSPPTSPAPQTAGRYTLVFQGSLGAEAGAIAGAVIRLNPTLMIAKSGTGSGTVTSIPPGISCGSTCSNSFSAGASIQLTAAPDIGSVFAGWGGDCAGAGTITVAKLTLTSEADCTAAFRSISSVSISSMSCIIGPSGAYLDLAASGSVSASGVGLSVGWEGSYIDPPLLYPPYFHPMVLSSSQTAWSASLRVYAFNPIDDPFTPPLSIRIIAIAFAQPFLLAADEATSGLVACQ